MTDFGLFTAADVTDLIAEYPLAWVLASAGGAALLPLIGEYDGDGALVSLLGHMGRRNPLHAALAADPAATILFNGPHGYVSPDHAGLRDWGPTWNYAQLAIAAEVVFVPDETEAAITRLTGMMEADRWTSAELGGRYHGMTAAIIAFRATVTHLSGRFKLGQDERPEVFETIVERHPDQALARWMKRFAAGTRGP